MPSSGSSSSSSESEDTPRRDTPARGDPCCPLMRSPSGDSSQETSETPSTDSALLLSPAKRERQRKPSEDHGKPISLCEILLLWAVVWVPSMLLVYGFSDIQGSGVQLYDNVSQKEYTYVAIALAGAVVLLVLLFYIIDLQSWGYQWRFFGGFCVTAMGLAVSICVAARYPFFPLAACCLLVLLLLVQYRQNFVMRVRRESYWGWVSLWMFLCGVTCLSLFYMWWECEDENAWCESKHGHKWTNATREEMATSAQSLVGFNYNNCSYEDATASLEAQADQRHQCQKVNTILYFIWALPMLTGIANLVGSGLMLGLGVVLQVGEAEEGHLSLEGALTLFVLCLTLLFAGFYISTGSLSAVSVSLSEAIVSFMVVIFGVTMMWLGFETDLGAGIAEGAAESEFVSMMKDFFHGDWGHAMIAGSIGWFIPIYQCLEHFKLRCSACTSRRKRKSRDEAEYHPSETSGAASSSFFAPYLRFPPVSVFLKICLLGELFFTFQVGVAKATFVFLSWLNDYMTEANWGLSSVIALTFAVGFTMFLLPPVPGVPVYIFCGIVVAKQGEHVLGFYGGIGLAILLGFVLKLVACTGQYGIGYLAGQSLAIQQLIGVDTVPTRAIESILKRDGLDWGKVMVLVGGPDWPTSVTCGILKLRMGQMLLGTVPVIVVLSPCVLAGAFMAKAQPGVPSSESTLAGVFLALSSVMQGGSMFEAMRNITNVVVEEGDELSRPRKAHEAVVEKTRKDQKYKDIYLATVDWAKLNVVLQVWVLLAAFLIYSSCAVFAFKASLAFENFEVSGHIRDPLNAYGLDNDALNIIKPPGYILLGMFAVGVILHVGFNQVTACMASCKEQGIDKRSGSRSLRTDVGTTSSRSSGDSHQHPGYDPI